MRVATWESSAGALATFLNAADQCFMADLYTITLTGGTVLRYTSADVAIAINGHTFALGPILRRGKTKLSVGISVDTLDVSVNADASVTVNSVPLLQFIAGGGLDGATVLLERAFAAAPGAAWVGTLGLFSGRVSDATVSRYEASLTVSSDSELLNTMVPRNVYQPGCSNTLFDAACGLSKAAFAVAVTATSATDATRTWVWIDYWNPGYFVQGYAVCLTGANAGVRRTIKTFTSGSVQSLQPWPAPIAAGDTFTMYPGCNKSQLTCQSGIFNNIVHFRGQPYVPAPETIT